MTVVAQIRNAALEAFNQLFPEADVKPEMIMVNQTKPEFEGDYTIVLFPFLKTLRMKPAELGQKLGDHLVANNELFDRYAIVAGFLNMTLKDAVWASFLQSQFNNEQYGVAEAKGKKVMIEYSSPNTNKPLHFGHMRNIFLGYAMSNILEAAGNDVVKSNLINDRGIHICKSMVAWQRYANGATPESTGMKGDKLVGDYYVRFNTELKKELAPYLAAIFNRGEIPGVLSKEDEVKVKERYSEISKLNSKLKDIKDSTDFSKTEGFGDQVKEAIDAAIQGDLSWKDVIKQSDKNESLGHKVKDALKDFLKALISVEAKIDEQKSVIVDIVTKYCSLTIDAKAMLVKWEQGDKEIVALWEKMNGWVYDGFDVSYARMGVDFDKRYYESNTYLLGKSVVEKGLQSGVFFKKEDGSVWINLEDEGLDQKLLLRADGTSVYITQDIGTAIEKYNDYKLDESVYVIGDEQNYHMQVLKLILKKMGEPCADGIFHLSYGMVELPTGRMKSREGTVVDADDMMDDMHALAQKQTEEAGKTEGFDADSLNKLYDTIGMGALKFYLLRVDPKKKMVFNPEESIDLHGFTAAFVQYAHARICSILRKEDVAYMPSSELFANYAHTQALTDAEKKLIITLEQYPAIVANAAEEYNPSLLCNYAFQVAQEFNSFYSDHSISKAENEEKKQLRIMLIVMVAQVLRHSMRLLGISLPEKM